MMYLVTLLLPVLSLSSLTQSLPASGSGLANAVKQNHKLHTKTTCSANQDGAIPDWAANPAWALNMTSCLETMNNDEWNGADCKPALADGTALGPSFGFWKGERKWHGDDDTGSSCYAECSDCLKQGIDWNQAQTTNCQFEYYTGLGAQRHHCQMGFDYGEWA